MRVFSVADAQRAYFEVGLPKLMWEHFETALLEKAKETRTTGKHSQLNHFKGHVRQVAPELGYTMKELEWVVIAEAMARGWPTRKVALSGGTVIEVPADPHAEASKNDFGILIDILHEIAFDNDIVLIENDERTTPEPDADSGQTTEQQVPDSADGGESGDGGGAAPRPLTQHEAESEEVSDADRFSVEPYGGEPPSSYGEAELGTPAPVEPA